jgi:hypothetical protein
MTESPAIQGRFVSVAVLTMVNRIDRSDKISFRTAPFPQIKGGPLIGHREIPVDFFQFQIKSIAELPEGVVYIDYGYLAHRCFILHVMCNVMMFAILPLYIPSPQHHPDRNIGEKEKKKIAALNKCHAVIIQQIVFMS